ncbi:MAG: aminoglycoside phosphotransferase family protein [Gemmatimonadales bacterium]
MTQIIPASLVASCAKTPARAEWLEHLPGVILELARRWSLTLGAPFEGEDVSCSWVAPAVGLGDTRVVLKIGMPHMEGEHEIDGLRLLDGDPTVCLLDADDKYGAMLLERCEPGTSLRELPEEEQDVVIAELLRLFWRTPPPGHPFRQLSVMLDHWTAVTRLDADKWPDRSLVEEGLDLFEDLAETAQSNMLLATDLHAGNVLRDERGPWVAIDPKPFMGDPAYDATQHLLNCRVRLRSRGMDTINRFADLLDVDRDRVQLWTFARLAAEPRDDWDDEATSLARLLAPVRL